MKVRPQQKVLNFQCLILISKSQKTLKKIEEEIN